MNGEQMQQVNIILLTDRNIFGEYVESIREAIASLGYNVLVTYDIGNNADINIVIKSKLYVDIDSIKGKKILYQSEELHDDRIRAFNMIYEDSEKWDAIWEMYEENIEFLKQHNKSTSNVFLCPYGYSPTYENDSYQLNKYDVYFYGSPTERRMKMFHDIEKTGWGKCHDPLGELFTTEIDSSKRIIRVTGNEYGRDRDMSVLRSKIVVNFRAYDNWRYAPLRGLIAQCKKRLYMVEKPNGGCYPYIDGKHFISFDGVDDFIEKAEYWINNLMRAKFEKDVYEDIKKNCRMVDFIRKLL
jgi:hypothetical protein